MFKINFLVLAFLLTGAVCNSAFAQDHQKALPKDSQTISYEMLVEQYNFPVKINTGNPEKDQRTYAAAKDRWIAANRELYRRYNQQGIKGSPELRKSAQPSLSPTK